MLTEEIVVANFYRYMPLLPSATAYLCTLSFVILLPWKAVDRPALSRKCDSEETSVKSVWPCTSFFCLPSRLITMFRTPCSYSVWRARISPELVPFRKITSPLGLA